MPKVIVWLVVAAVGVTAYVAGTKAGRARYREISAAAKQVWDDPTVAKVRARGRKAVEKTAKKVAKKIT
jgi:hypothetical protein